MSGIKCEECGELESGCVCETSIEITYHNGNAANITSKHLKILESFDEIVEKLSITKQDRCLFTFLDFAVNPDYIITIRKIKK